MSATEQQAAAQAKAAKDDGAPLLDVLEEDDEFEVRWFELGAVGTRSVGGRGPPGYVRTMKASYPTDTGAACCEIGSINPGSPPSDTHRTAGVCGPGLGRGRGRGAGRAAVAGACNGMDVGPIIHRTACTCVMLWGSRASSSNCSLVPNPNTQDDWDDDKADDGFSRQLRQELDKNKA